MESIFHDAIANFLFEINLGNEIIALGRILQMMWRQTVIAWYDLNFQNLQLRYKNWYSHQKLTNVTTRMSWFLKCQLSN